MPRVISTFSDEETKNYKLVNGDDIERNSFSELFSTKPNVWFFKWVPKSTFFENAFAKMNPHLKWEDIFKEYDKDNPKHSEDVVKLIDAGIVDYKYRELSTIERVDIKTFRILTATDLLGASLPAAIIALPLKVITKPLAAIVSLFGKSEPILKSKELKKLLNVSEGSDLENSLKNSQARGGLGTKAKKSSISVKPCNSSESTKKSQENEMGAGIHPKSAEPAFKTTQKTIEH